MRGFQFPYHSSNGKNSKIKLKKGCEIMSEKDNKIDQIIRTIEENDVKFLKLQISDIHGLPKSMAVPLKKADDIEDIVNDGLLFDGSSIASQQFHGDLNQKVPADSFVMFTLQKENHMTETQGEFLKEHWKKLKKEATNSI